MKMTKTKTLVFAGMIAAVYTALSFIPGVSVLSFGPVQLRIAESLNALALLSPWAIPGLAIGCFVTNLASPMMAVDLPFGTLATLIGAAGAYFLRRKPGLAMLVPVISNGIIVGALINLFLESGFGLFTNIGLVAVGEAAACYIFGLPLYKSLKRFFTEI